MANDEEGYDLGVPLGLKLKRRSLLRRIPFGLLGVGLIAMFVSALVIWVSFLPDPMGGEPTAVVRVDRSKSGVPLKDIAVATPGKPEAPAGDPPPAAAPKSDVVQTPVAAPPAARPVQTTRRPGMPAEGQPLPTLTVGRVSENSSRFGVLPRVAGDGTRPMEVYSRPAVRRSAGTPRVVLIIGGLGLSQVGTQEALRLMPPDVTLAFAPYGSDLERWATRARQDGHELLVQVPMEPFDYPDNDPGPQTLLSSASPDDNLERLRWAMSRITTYVGVINYMGGKLTSSEDQMRPILQEVMKRGLLYIDDGSSTRSMAEASAKAVQAPFLRTDVVIDSTATDGAIQARLGQLESLARANGVAVGVATALPISLRNISEWLKQLDSRGVVVVPASAAARTD